MLADLLAHPDVEEVCQLRGTFGFMAFHGGGLEEATDIIAQHAAEATGSSYYGIHQPADLKWHVPSHRIDPQHSETLSQFINHVDTVITIHGFGRQGFFTSLLLGGRNRGLATHVAQHLRTALPAYSIATMECKLSCLRACAVQVRCGGIGKVHISHRILNHSLMDS